MTDPYRETLIAQVEALQNREQKLLSLWTREEIQARLTRMYVADYDLPQGTQLTEEQIWRIGWERNPALRPLIESRFRDSGKLQKE